MHRTLTLTALALLAVGCGSSHSSPRPPRPAAQTPVARLETVPPSSPLPTPKGGYPTPNAALRATFVPATAAPQTPTPIPADAFTATVKGRVTDSGTGKPVAGAAVAIPNSTHSTSTGPQGYYRLAFPGNLSAPLTVSRKGYYQSVSIGSIQPGRQYTLNFRLVRRAANQAPPAPSIFGPH